ncbi:MAG: hypothetical protein U1F65_00760 [Verrucomicrobiota bacterium]
MKRQTKFTTGEEQQLSAGQETQAQTFATVEEMLRHDSIRTPVPPEIEQRLQKSAAELPEAKRSWFKKLFGG